jgi:hypothetical protein
VLVRNAWRQAALQPHKSEQLSRIRAALRLRR